MDDTPVQFLEVVQVQVAVSSAVNCDLTNALLAVEVPETCASIEHWTVYNPAACVSVISTFGDD